MSVVVPTRDRRALLARTLRSALAQRDVALEVVVVDEGSSDGTGAMLAAHPDPRVRALRHDRPLGVSAARNAGVAAARAAWVAFLDDDDLWAPDKLARQIAAADAGGRAWACSGSVTFVDDAASGAARVVAGAPPPGAAAIAEALPRRNQVPAGASNVVARRDAVLAAGGFDVALRHVADWDLWIRLGQQGPPAVVAEPHVAYRLHGGNASADSAAIAHEIARVEERTSALRGGAPVDRAFVYRWTAWHLLRAGRRAAALRAYARAAAEGDALSLGRALVAVVAPGAARRPRRRHGLDARWIAAAEAWLRACGGGAS